jgi:preprotein translocase SecE subunit
MIATEGEMKKVNWSTRREVTGSTTVVIALTVFIALLCFLFDTVFNVVFKWLGVLKSI